MAGKKLSVNLDSEKLKTIMKKKGLSNDKLSRMMGCTPETISNWKNGTYAPKSEKFVQLCAILDCNDSDLLKDPEPEPKEEPVQIVRSEIAKPDMSASVPRGTFEGYYTPALHGSGTSFGDLTALLHEQINANTKIMEQIQKDNAELREMLKTAIDIIEKRESVDVMQIGAVSMELCDYNFRQFKKTATEKANMVMSKHKTYKSTNSVWSDAYKLLRAEYGVVWEQEKKDFIDVNGYPPASTLQLCYWIEANKPAYHNLFLTKLDTLAK